MAHMTYRTLDVQLYGFLVDNVFHMLWWDPEHEIWPSRKKHT